MARAPNTIRFAKRVRRRALAASLVTRCGVGLAVGGVVGLAGVLAGRAGWLGQDFADRWILVLGVSIGVGLLAGVVAGLVGRWSLASAAGRADRTLGLHDRLGNALSFSSPSGGGVEGAEPGPAERVAIQDAERVVESVSATSVVRMRFGAAWSVWPVAVAAAVASGIWVPVAEPDDGDAVSQAASEPERRAAADVIAEAARDAREALAEGPAERAGASALAQMDAIERELLDGSSEPGEAIAQGARALEALADRVEREAETEALASQRTQEQLAENIEPDPGASDLARALSEGDLERAREAAADLLERYDQMPAEERERYAEELERLAEQMENLSQDALPDPRESAIEESLREQGIDEPGSLDESIDPGALQEQLEDRGVEPEAARDLAEDLAERNRQRQAEERARDEVRELSDAASDAADELREPPPSESPPASEQQGEDPAEQGTGGEPSENGDQSPGQEPREQPGQDSGEQTERGGEGEASPDEQGDQTGRDGERQPTDEGNDQQPGDDQQGTESEPRDDAGGDQERPGETQDETQGETPDEQSGDERGQDPSGRGDEGSQTGEESMAEPGSEPGQGQERFAPEEGDDQSGTAQERMTDGDGDAPSPGGVERFRRQLERMAERGRGAQEGSESAEQLREKARQMLEQASPEERRALEEMARDATREEDDRGEGDGASREPRDRDGPTPAPDREWQSEPFDAHGQPRDDVPDAGQVIADWLGAGDKPATGGASSPPSGPTMQEAARGAERAIERRAVPRDRKDLVRRVFERFRRRVTEEQSAPEAQSDEPAGGE